MISRIAVLLVLAGVAPYLATALPVVAAPPDLGSLARTNADLLRFSTLFTAQNVRDELATAEGIDRAIAWCRSTGVTRVYLETFRNGYRAGREVLIRARERFRAAGFLVSGCITTTGLGRKSVRGWVFPCFTEEAGLDRLRSVCEYSAELFDEIMIDDFFATRCECRECIEARGEETWSRFRCDLLVDVSRRVVLEPARKVRPGVRFIIKYPQWYEDFHNRGYDVVRQTAMFDAIWVGTETRDPDSARWGRKSQYEAYFIMRWLGAIGGDRCGGGWFDPFGTTEHTYLEQARQTILGGAREALLFCYGALQRDTGPANVRALRRELPGLFELARLVRGREFRGIAAPRPPGSDGDGDRYVHDFIGLLGLPLIPSPELPTAAPAVLLPVQALAAPRFRAGLEAYLKAKTPLLVTRNLAEHPSLRGVALPDEVAVLDIPGEKWDLMDLAPARLRAIRKLLLAPFGVDLEAPTRVALYLPGKDLAVVENFNDRPVDVTLRFRPPAAPSASSTRTRPEVVLTLPPARLSPATAPGSLDLRLPARSLAAVRHSP